MGRLPIRNSSSSRLAVLMLLQTHRSAESFPAPRLRRAALLLTLVVVAAIVAGACAAATASHNARRAEDRQEYDRAVAEYLKAIKLNPDDANARAGLERSKLRAATDHFQRGRRLAGTGKLDQALIEYQLASELNPTSADVEDALRQTRNQLRSKVAVSHEGKTQLETLI